MRIFSHPALRPPGRRRDVVAEAGSDQTEMGKFDQILNRIQALH